MPQQEVISFTFTIKAAKMTVSSPPPPDGRIGTPYSHQFTVAGGTGAITWAVTGGGPLPAWATLGASGLLSGLPDKMEIVPTIEVTVTDSEP